MCAKVHVHHHPGYRYCVKTVSVGISKLLRRGLETVLLSNSATGHILVLIFTVLIMKLKNSFAILRRFCNNMQLPLK